MRNWLRQRPWVWILLLFAFFIVGDLILVFIAVKDAPELLRQ